MIYHTNRIAGKILFVLFPVTLSLAQRIGFTVSPVQHNRRFSLSTRAPLTHAINDLTPDVIPHVDLILKHASRVENAVRKSLTRLHFDANEPVQPCSQRIDRGYRESVWRGFALQGFAEPAFNCASDVHGVLMSRNDEPGYTLDDLYKAIFNRGVAIKRRVKDIALRVIDNFTSPGVPFNYTFSTVTAHCSMSAVCLAREGEHWRNILMISNAAKDHFLVDGHQQSIAEYARVVDGKLGDNMLMRLPVIDNGKIERVILDNTTTMIQSWAGNPNPSCFREIPVDENPAMLEAIDLADHSSQIVEDALTSSNMAILLLPLGLNLIPLSLIAEQGTIAILLYTLLSDVLTVIPLGIKGVELVIIQKRKFRSVVTRVISPELRNSTKPFASGGEMWGAECQVKNDVRKTGYALIITAIVFLVLGVGAEIAAKKYLVWRRGTRRWARKLEQVDGGLFAHLPSRDQSVSRSSNETVRKAKGSSGIRKYDQIGTGDIAERYSADLERDDAQKERLRLFR